MTVKTVKTSMATMSVRWLSGNVRQVCAGGLRCRTMYLATVVSVTS